MYPMHPTPLQIACVASVSTQVWRESWDENKEKEWQGRGRERRKQRFLFSPPLSPFILFFCSCSNFCTITQLEMLATHVTLPKVEPSCIIGHVVYIGECQKRGGQGTTFWPKQSILLPRLCGPKSFQDQPLLSKTSQRMIDIFIFSSREDLFAKSAFFPANIFTQKCGTGPVTHHHYSPKEILPRKESPSWKG